MQMEITQAAGSDLRLSNHERIGASPPFRSWGQILQVPVSGPKYTLQRSLGRE